MQSFKRKVWLGMALGCLALPVAAAEVPRYDRYCVQNALEEQDANTTLEQVRAQCMIGAYEDLDKSALAKRIESERRNRYNQFAIESYRPNYLLFASYNFAGTNEAPFQQNFSGNEFFDPVEVKFQISLKIPVTEQVLGWGDHWFIAYTNRSFWQAYNKSISAPFRETNHEPEAWVSFDNDWNLFGWQNRLVDLGFVHQSNGQSGNLSRSWNRAYLRLVFEKGNSAFGIKPWIRMPENGQDDNPEIEEYMGNSDFYFITKQNDHTLSFLVRNNFNEKHNKGAFEFGYTYPIHRNLNAYVQWFYGYGESLIDYNYLNNTLSIGVQLGNWL